MAELARCDLLLGAISLTLDAWHERRIEECVLITSTSELDRKMARFALPTRDSALSVRIDWMPDKFGKY
jgi:hypothetical protein